MWRSNITRWMWLPHNTISLVKIHLQDKCRKLLCRNPVVFLSRKHNCRKHSCRKYMRSRGPDRLRPKSWSKTDTQCYRSQMVGYFRQPRDLWPLALILGNKPEWNQIVRPFGVIPVLKHHTHVRHVQLDQHRVSSRPLPDQGPRGPARPAVCGSLDGHVDTRCAGGRVGEVEVVCREVWAIGRCET